MSQWSTIPLDPEPETFQPVIEDCMSNPLGVTVLPYIPEDDDDQMVEDEIQIDVMKTVDPQQAYVRIPTKPTKPLDHHGQGWGCVYFGFVVKRVQGGGQVGSLPTFQAPTPEEVQYVAIKRLRKSVVQQYLDKGGHENPYVELSRMQEYGDNIHILGCLEALQDDTFLYIITPYCDCSLEDCIPWRQQAMIPEEQARMYFEQLLDNVRYLQRHRICHRDLSPDNCMVYQGRLVLTDLAMSFRVPLPTRSEPEHNRGPTLVKSRGKYGTAPCVPPEVFFGMPFDPYACDLWSSITVLFNLLTGEILYEQPTPGNLKFRYFVMARGASRTPRNEQTMELYMTEMNDVPAERPAIIRMIQKILQLTPEVLELLENVFKVTPHERWTLDHVERCEWIQSYRQQLYGRQQPH